MNRNFDVIVIGKNAFADEITVTNSAFSDISGTVIKANAETDDYGQYGAEYVTISQSAFSDIGCGIASLYRGGRDESTFGPHFKLAGSALSDVGGDTAPALTLHGVQQASISGSSFANSGPIEIIHTVGTPRTTIMGNSFDRADPVAAQELNYDGAPRILMSDNTNTGTAE